MWTKKLLLFVIIGECLSTEAPAVLTNSGKIVGHYLTSFKGNVYQAYQGVPYALPPTGQRRFEPPTPMPPWPNELLATDLRSMCLQHEILSLRPNNVADDDEDCLYLNVFVPRRKANATLPVLFWIHGGGFLSGGSAREEEAYLMDYDVVLVTIQYRLGAFGFLSTEDEVVPGNMGLKDQSLALRWVHDNIQYFGGDPHRITLFGQSAGGSSLHYHYFSPMSAGLFQNGISYSGTAYGWFAQGQASRQKALELGKLMNCTTSNIKETVNCLRERPAREIVKLLTKLIPWRMNMISPFGPVAEKSSKNPFVDRRPREAIKSGKVYDVPWITGTVSEEALNPAIVWADDAGLKDINDNWDSIAPYMLGFYNTIPKENLTRVAQVIRKHYFGEKPIDKETFMTLVYLMTDRWAIEEAENAAEALAKTKKSPVWSYYYNYRAVDSMKAELSNNTRYSGVCHGDDIYLILKDPHMNPTKSSRDLAMQSLLITLLTSYATNNKPALNIEWPKLDSSDEIKYLQISGPETSKISVITSDDLGQQKFWNSINVDEP